MSDASTQFLLGLLTKKIEAQHAALCELQARPVIDAAAVAQDVLAQLVVPQDGVSPDPEVVIAEVLARLPAPVAPPTATEVAALVVVPPAPTAAEVAALVPQAKDGEDGADGEDGEDGKPGERGPMPKHRWTGTKLQFEKPDGEWGKAVDLKGPKGADGKTKGVFAGGFSSGSVDPSTLIDDSVARPDRVYSSEKVEALLSGSGENPYIRVPAGTPLGGNRVVRLSGGVAVYADNQTIGDANVVLGLTRGAVSAGAQVEIQTTGLMIEPSWNWTPDEPVFVGASGVPVQPAPESGFCLIVGVATSPTQIFIRAEMPIILQE